jgi:hypothetical protein
MKAIERLERLLDEKDKRIEQLEERLSHYEDEDGFGWQRPRLFRHNRNGLPVPRLEVLCEKKSDDWSHWDCVYGIFYRHFSGDFVFLTLGLHKVNDGKRRPPITNGRPDLSPTLLVDLQHDMEQFKLPAFIIIEKQVFPFAG